MNGPPTEELLKQHTRQSITPFILWTQLLEHTHRVWKAQAFSRAGDPGKCLGVCRQAFGQLKRQGQSTDPRCWQLGAHLYVVAGACVVAAKGTKAKVKLTKQDDAGEYFLMAFQLCFPFSSVLLLRETCLWLSSCMAEDSPLLAGHFLSLGMQLTLTHQAVYSIGQKLSRSECVLCIKRLLQVFVVYWNTDYQNGRAAFVHVTVHIYYFRTPPFPDLATGLTRTVDYQLNEPLGYHEVIRCRISEALQQSGVLDHRYCNDGNRSNTTSDATA
ncbi:hypothetical protein EMCRGX_G027283 [Ephydatia muelleri]